VYDKATELRKACLYLIGKALPFNYMETEHLECEEEISPFKVKFTAK
jgi:hypothetical protein